MANAMFKYFYQSHHDNIFWQVSLSQLIHQSIKLYHESIKQIICMYHQLIHIHFPILKETQVEFRWIQKNTSFIKI